MRSRSTIDVKAIVRSVASWPAARTSKVIQPSPRRPAGRTCSTAPTLSEPMPSAAATSAATPGERGGAHAAAQVVDEFHPPS